MLNVNILISRTKEIGVDLVFIRRMMRLHNRCVSRAFLFHRNEWSVAFVILIVFLSVRLDKAVENARARVKLDDELTYFKKTHQAERIKEWVTSQYCKADLEILCPPAIPLLNSVSTCDLAFDPPLRFVLDLPETTQGLRSTNSNNNPTVESGCPLTELIKHSNWHDHDTINEFSADDVLTYFIAHVLEQVRSKSVKYFRSEKDRSIEEFEQSRLIESALASVTNLFSLPTKFDDEGNGLSTKAIDLKMTNKMWSRNEVISLMHDAVLWHTHHRRNGSTEAGAALRVSRQMPSFVFKFLPLVKEQIQNLELDDTTQLRVQRLYSTEQSAPLIGKTSPHSVVKDKQQLLEEAELSAADQCLWAHYEEGCLISHDCMLALETAPLKSEDAAGRTYDLPLILVHLYTFFSAALMLWTVARLLEQEGSRFVETPPEMEIPFMKHRHSSSSSGSNNNNNNHKSTKHEDPEEVSRERIRTMQKACLGYLATSSSIGLAAHYWVPSLQFSDFLDGLCLGLLGFLSLHVVPYKSPYGQCGNVHKRHEKSGHSLDRPPTDRHYKKRASMEPCSGSV